MAEEGAIECLILLLESANELTQRQAAKALANLGVSNENKPKIADAGGIPKLVRLAGISSIGVRIEAVAALANLAVNGQ
jgi:HEAT repeat protein